MSDKIKKMLTGHFHFTRTFDELHDSGYLLPESIKDRCTLTIYNVVRVFFVRFWWMYSGHERTFCRDKRLANIARALALMVQTV